MWHFPWHNGVKVFLESHLIIKCFYYCYVSNPAAKLWAKKNLNRSNLVQQGASSSQLGDNCLLRQWPCVLLLGCQIKTGDLKKRQKHIKDFWLKKSDFFFILLPAFSLTIWLMTSQKNFEKLVILKIWQLVFLRGVKTYFGILPLKRCIFRHEKNGFK